jgi:radical SAM superfamily enzyme YgiQ (UPF0313 family)
MEEIRDDIALAQRLMPETRRVFLADGNALILGTERLTDILDSLASGFPLLRRVGIYANARDILKKSDADLALLRLNRLEIIYLGLESGSATVLRQIQKDSTPAEMLQAVRKAKRAGIRVSVIALLGIAGPALSGQHAEETGRLVSAMDPEYLSLLTLMLVPGTELHRQHQARAFELMRPEELLAEMRAIITHTEGLSRCIFRTNHASNYLPLAGTLSRDKARLLAALDRALDLGSGALRPEEWRAL